MPALGGVPGVRAPHADEPAGEINICLAQPEQFALAKSGVDGSGEERPPFVRESGEHARDLVEVQECGKPLGHAPAFHIQDGVLPDLSRPTGGTEHSAEEGAKVVHRLGRQFARLRLDELLDPTGRHFPDPVLRDVSVDEMLVEGPAASRVRRRGAEVGILPPAQQIAERGVVVGQGWLQAESPPFGMAFELRSQALGLGLGLGRRGAPAPSSVRVLELREPTNAAFDDR